MRSVTARPAQRPYGEWMNVERCATRRKLSIEQLKEQEPKKEREQPRVDEEADTAPLPMSDLEEEVRRRSRREPGSSD